MSFTRAQLWIAHLQSTRLSFSQRDPKCLVTGEMGNQHHHRHLRKENRRRLEEHHRHRHRQIWENHHQTVQNLRRKSENKTKQVKMMQKKEVDEN